MRKTLLFLLALSVTGSMMAQQSRVAAPKKIQELATAKPAFSDEQSLVSAPVNPYVSSRIIPTETEMGGTIYDSQTNASMAPRVELFDDGTIGATWTRGTGPTAYNDRGTGYNYYNGTTWGATPTNRLEINRSGWPSYTACGPTGEAVVSHRSGTLGLNFLKRDVKGSGAWVETAILAPAGASGLLWPRIISSGADNNILHLFAMTAPTGNGGTVYAGQNGAMLYYRSADAGNTWAAPVILDGMASEYYTGFSGDSYSLTAKGDDVAFLISDNWVDMFLMKSSDNGENWTKTIIWEHPIPLWNNTPSIDTIYCPDGSSSLVFDNSGRVHIAFGVNRSYFADGGTDPSYFPFVDGLAYWNEDMDSWTGGDQVNILDPDNLYESGHLIGYLLDLNENGQFDYVGTELANIGLYGIGTTSMPQLVINESNQLFVIFVALTEGYDNSVQQYRHLWARTSPDGGTTWGDFYHLSEDVIHILDECVFPAAAADMDGKVHLIYQVDTEPGTAIGSDADVAGENIIYYMQIEEEVIMGVTHDLTIVSDVKVSQNYPNPFNGSTSFDVTISGSSKIAVEVFNVTGQKVMDKSYGNFGVGTHRIDISSADLHAGIYFYTVKAGETTSTGKMTVL